ncbi:MAG: hypothetical protein FIB08_03175 [Candidatus Methanoperedens sp.]|nr:hypothetical protein [Candidatus Methanoperedens sp.]
MIAKKMIFFSLAMLLAIYPASAGEVTLNRWALNVIIHDNGTVEEIIQTEIENGGSSPLDGFSFVVPPSKITEPVISTFSPNGQKVQLQPVTGGTKVTINFNSKLETGKKWDGRIEFNADNWAEKVGQDYSINIPVEAPQAIISGKDTRISIPAEPEIRSQVFLPKSVNPTFVEPSIDPATKKPAYKKLLQYNKFTGADTGADLIVLTWFKLNIGDVMSIKASYSDELNRIVEANGRFKRLSDSIKTEKTKGKDVSAAEAHLSNAKDYNNQALDEFWGKKDATASLDSANNEMNQAEKSLQASDRTATGQTTKTPESQKTPASGALPVIGILLFITLLRRKK